MKVSGIRGVANKLLNEQWWASSTSSA